MKVLISVLSVIALLGIVYGLAFIGVIPVKKLADKNPIAAKALIAMKLVSKKKPASSALLVVKPSAPDPLAAQKAELQQEHLQLLAEKARIEQKQQAAATAAPPSPPRTSPKVSAIYDTMKSDELAVIFAKLPDYQVCDALSKMDEKKAGKVLVALPPTRAAKLTVMLNRATAAPAGQQAVR